MSTEPDQVGSVSPGEGASRPARAARSTGRAGVDDIATVQLPSMERIRALASGDLADGQSPAVELAAAWPADADNPALARALALLCEA